MILSPLGFWRKLKEGMREATRLKGVEQALIADFHANIENGNCLPNEASECLDAITINVKRKETDKVKR